MLKSIADSIKKTIDETYQADFERFLLWLEDLPQKLKNKCRPIHARLETLAFDHPARLAIYFTLLAFIIVLFLSWSYWGDHLDTFKENVLVEAHGMVMDLLIIVFLYSWFQSRGERKQRIRRYLEEIEDYRIWEGEEAKFRIASLIKRLNNEDYDQRLDLFQVSLQNIKLFKVNLQNANLQWAELQGAKLHFANLQEAYLQGAKLQGAILMDAGLQKADFNGANLQGAVLLRANLQNASLYGANLNGANLEKTNLIGANFQYANLKDTKNLADNPTLLQVKTLHYAKIDQEVIEAIERAGREDLFDPLLGYQRRPKKTGVNQI